MPLCGACGGVLRHGLGYCPGHENAYPIDWATANRTMCDFVHRGIPAPRMIQPKPDNSEAQEAGMFY